MIKDIEKMQSDAKKVRKVIQSCETIEQLVVAGRMMLSFDDLYDSYYSLRSLDLLYTLRYKQLRRLRAPKEETQ